MLFTVFKQRFHCRQYGAGNATAAISAKHDRMANRKPETSISIAKARAAPRTAASRA
jgi:hypothetical protein